MADVTIWSGDRRRHVVVSGREPHLTARLYVNGGDTPTLRYWRGKTMAGARRWAEIALSDEPLGPPDIVCRR